MSLSTKSKRKRKRKNKKTPTISTIVSKKCTLAMCVFFWLIMECYCQFPQLGREELFLMESL